MILGTSFVLDLLDGDEGAVAKAKELERDGVRMKLPTTTILELSVGIVTAVREDQERRIRRVIDRLPVGPLDENVAMRAGRRIGEVGSSRFKRRKGDAAVGATAAVVDEPVSHGTWTTSVGSASTSRRTNTGRPIDSSRFISEWLGSRPQSNRSGSGGCLTRTHRDGDSNRISRF